jgi:nucleoside-diphosphate-sugar epimerase
VSVPATSGATPAPGGPCLITGASGFIGGRLAARMATSGRPLRCLARAGSDVSALNGLDLQIVRGDLADPVSLAAAAAGCERVVHCAALVSDWATVAEIKATNVVGTRNLLAAAAQAGVRRVVHISTTDIYGHPGRRDVAETAQPGRFSNWYAQTKLEAEEELLQAAAGNRLQAVVLRPATVYGPGSTDVVGEIAKALRGGHMLLIGRGEALAGLCYVENLIDAILLALEEPAADGCAFNISDGLDVTWRRFTGDLAAGLGCPAPRLSLPYLPAAAVAVALEQGYRLLRRATGLATAPLLSRQAVQVLGRDQDFSNDAARRTLGWQPRVGYAEGLAATLAWLQASVNQTTLPAGSQITPQ